MDITPRMIFGMNADQVAGTIATLGRAADVEPTSQRFMYLSLASSMATILRLQIGSDDANNQIEAQIKVLDGCIAQVNQPVGEEVDAWLKTQAR